MTTRSAGSKDVRRVEGWLHVKLSNSVLLENDTARCETEQEGRQYKRGQLRNRCRENNLERDQSVELEDDGGSVGCSCHKTPFSLRGGD